MMNPHAVNCVVMAGHSNVEERVFDLSYGLFHGTAFCVAPNLFLTAAHVLRALRRETFTGYLFEILKYLQKSIWPFCTVPVFSSLLKPGSWFLHFGSLDEKPENYRELSETQGLRGLRNNVLVRRQDDGCNTTRQVGEAGNH
jgi:hypothetical protein